MKQITSYEELREKIEALRTKLLDHPIYNETNDLASLKTFMSSHIFAVWDFMSLLKVLQNRLTCVSIPWMPPSSPLASRLINEIVLGEESDEIAPGVFTSHFDLYLAAMKEVGADSTQMKNFLADVGKGVPASEALKNVSIPEATKEFVRHTLSFTVRETHEVAASFLFGREDVIPQMFQRILNTLNDEEGTHGLDLTSFKRYLERHIEVDEGSHAPMATRMLRELCEENPRKWTEAYEAAASAVEARIQLWDGMRKAIAEAQMVEEILDLAPTSVIGPMRLVPAMGF